MKLNCIIVDDERHPREFLCKMLETSFSELVVVGKAANAKSARELLKAHHVDLIFCDVQMPNENGLDFISSLDNTDYFVVFITAYSNYALQAIKVRAFDYIVKPFDPEELEKTIQKIKSAWQKTQLKSHDAAPELLPEVPANTLSPQSKIGISHLTGTSLISLDDIYYLEGDGAYTQILLSNSQKITCTKNLRGFEKKLPPHFFRIHKSTIVNLHYVIEIKKNLGVSVVLENLKELFVSRRNTPALLEKFKEFIQMI